MKPRIRNENGLSVEEIASHIHLRYDAPTKDLMLEFFYKAFVTVNDSTLPFSGDDFEVVRASSNSLLTRDLGTGCVSPSGHVLNGINGMDLIVMFKKLAADLYDEQQAAQVASQEA